MVCHVAELILFEWSENNATSVTEVCHSLKPNYLLVKVL